MIRALCIILAIAVSAGAGRALGALAPADSALGNSGSDRAIATTYRVAHPRGLMVTSGGWAYCEQLRTLAHRTGYELMCGRYAKDEYLGPGLRSRRHLDWGDPQYLASFAAKIQAAHRAVGGSLVLVGVSYSGFGVATLASHNPELRPDRLVVIDSYLDLEARRKQLPDSHETAREIDGEVGRSVTALRQRSPSVDGLARLVRDGTVLTAIWSVSDDERQFFNGATCNRRANAQTLASLAQALRRPVSAWVTANKHGRDLWRYGQRIIEGFNPGQKVVFPVDGSIPESAVCR